MDTGNDPAEFTAGCANFKRQINALSSLTSWDREVNTTDPNYYKLDSGGFSVSFTKKGKTAYGSGSVINWVGGNSHC